MYGKNSGGKRGDDLGNSSKERKSSFNPGLVEKSALGSNNK